MNVHEPSALRDLVRHEIAQRRETGYLTSGVEQRFSELGLGDTDGLRTMYEEVLNLDPPVDVHYEEPSDLDSIVGLLPSSTERVSIPTDLGDRIHGAWLGRVAGCMLGKPVEAERWTSTLLREYLELAGAYPITDYIPALDPMPEGFEFRESWPLTTLGRVDGSARDDDIDYTILALHLLECHGADLTTADIARSWLELLPYHQVYTAERATYRNLVLGVAVSEAADHENPYREWIGAQIRGDMFGWVNPGFPRKAAIDSYRDAALSHRGNGIYGEMWVAALCAAAFVETSIPDAIAVSLQHIPARSRLFEAVADVMELHARGVTWDRALAHIQARYGHYFIVHTVNNAAIVTAGLLWGDHDFGRTVGLTVQGAWDTDSNGATAGSVAGAFLGAAGIPTHFSGPLNDTVRSAVLGFDGSSIADLAERTFRLAVGR